MVEACEFFMETSMQGFLQWYLVAVRYYELKFAPPTQVFSISKSLWIFPIGFAKICIPQIFHGDQQESLSRSIKRIAWNVNLIFTITVLLFQSVQTSALYLKAEFGNHCYFLLPFAITSVFLSTVLVFDKIFKDSWRRRLKCVAFTFWFLSIGILGCQFVFTQTEFIFLSIPNFLYSTEYFLMILHGFYFVCVFGKASLSKSASSVLEPDQLLGSSYISNFVTSIPIFMNMVNIVLKIYIFKSLPDPVTTFCPDVVPGQT